MASFLSWDYFMNMTGEFKVDLECILIPSYSSDMGPLVSRNKSKSLEAEDIEMDIPMSPPPIYRDTLCTFAKGDSMRWYQVYQEFARTEFPEDLPNREIYLKVKRSKLHLAGAHPAIFPCPEMIDWIIQKTDPKKFVIRDSEGKAFTTLKGSDAHIYYSFPEREEDFTEEWAIAHAVPIVDTLKRWWDEPEKFKVKKDQEYPVAGLRKVYKLVATMICKFYGLPNATTFSGTWETLMEYVMTHGTRFN